MFVYLDSAWHPIADDETTACGLVVPHGTDWQRQVPDGEGIHCGPDATPETVAKPKAAPKPKAKKKG